MKQCSIPGCAKPLRARGICGMHAARLANTGTYEPTKFSHRNDAERYEFYVPDRPVAGCWLWTGSLVSGGYGAFRKKPTLVLAHRWAYETFNGPIGQGLVVRHTCDVPACVRPDHLLIGTHSDNSRDAVERNRIARGVRVTRHILDDDAVREIRQAYADGGVSLARLAARYGVVSATIGNVVHQRTWRHVAEDGVHA